MYVACEMVMCRSFSCRGKLLILQRVNIVQLHVLAIVCGYDSCTVLRLQCVEKDKAGRFVLHCLQLRPKMVCKTLECHKMVNISSQSEILQGFPVRVSIFTILFLYLTGFVYL